MGVSVWCCYSNELFFYGRLEELVVMGVAAVSTSKLSSNSLQLEKSRTLQFK